MIDFLTKPAVARALLGSATLLLLLCAGLAGSTVYFEGRYRAEAADHKTTRMERDTAVKEGLGWKAVAGAANEQRESLRGALNECLARERDAHEDAAERSAIMQQAAPRERTEAERKGVVDDATRTKVMDRLNRPL